MEVYYQSLLPFFVLSLSYIFTFTCAINIQYTAIIFVGGAHQEDMTTA